MNRLILHIVFVGFSFVLFAQSDLKKNDFDRNKWNELRKSIGYEGVVQEPIEGEASGGDMEFGEGSGQDGDGYDGSGSGGSGSGGGSSSGSGSGDSKNYSRDQSSRELSRNPEINPPQTQNFDPPSISVNPAVMWVILIIIILVIIALIVFLIVKNAGNNKGVKSGLNDIEIHDINPIEIPKTELEIRLEKAIQEEDYRECVRIYFIYNMKALIENHHIRWEKEKTNMDYLQEVYGKPFYGSFYNVVTLFEIVWYGERDMTKEQFAQVEPELKKCLAAID